MAPFNGFNSGERHPATRRPSRRVLCMMAIAATILLVVILTDYISNGSGVRSKRSVTDPSNQCDDDEYYDKNIKKCEKCEVGCSTTEPTPECRKECPDMYPTPETGLPTTTATGLLTTTADQECDITSCNVLITFIVIEGFGIVILLIVGYIIYDKKLKGDQSAENGKDTECIPLRKKRRKNIHKDNKQGDQSAQNGEDTESTPLQKEQMDNCQNDRIQGDQSAKNGKGTKSAPSQKQQMGDQSAQNGKDTKSAPSQKQQMGDIENKTSDMTQEIERKKQGFEERDTDKSGKVSLKDFLEILADVYLKLDKSHLAEFLASCSIPQEVDYKMFLLRFQNSNDKTDPRHNKSDIPDAMGTGIPMGEMETKDLGKAEQVSEAFFRTL